MKNWRFRTTLFGRLVLQVRYRVPSASIGVMEDAWRDADTQDLGEYYSQIKEMK